MNDVVRDMLIWFAKFAAISAALFLALHIFLRRRRKPTKPEPTDEKKT
jgi:hypothetical protein